MAIRVLLVDDSATIRMSIGALLTKHGYTVETADDGSSALTLLERMTPDVVITDLNMPHVNGIDFVKALRTRQATRFTPVLLLTNESQRAKRDLAKDAGATGWIVKPVAAEDLVDVLETVLPAAKAMGEARQAPRA